MECTDERGPAGHLAHGTGRRLEDVCAHDGSPEDPWQGNSGSAKQSLFLERKLQLARGPVRGTNSAHMSGLGHSLFAGLGIAEGSEEAKNKLNMATVSTRPLDSDQIQLLLP